MGTRRWPSLEYLSVREHRHACEQFAELQYQHELIEEQRRAREGVRIQSLKEFQEGLLKGQVLYRIPGEIHEWSHWITETREIKIAIMDLGDNESHSALLDSRGQPVGLFERDTFRLDHFVSWDEFIRNYQLWSRYGIPPRDEEGPREEGDDARGPIVIAPIDAIQEGRLPLQPNDGKFEEPPPASCDLPKADILGEELMLFPGGYPTIVPRL